MSKREITHAPSRRQALFWLLLLIVVPFIFLLKNKIAGYFYNRTQCEEPRRREWQNFAVPIPPGYSVHGIDVSHYSCDIDWAGVKEMNTSGVTVDFVYMRATRGTELVDYQFDKNWENVKKAGLLRGAYHFFYFAEDPIAQAAFFLDNVKIESGDLPPVLDLEDDRHVDDKKIDKEKILKNIETWLRIIENKTGVKPMIYANLDYYKRYIAGPRFQSYPIWIAGYNMRSVKLPDNRQWWFWQTSESARVNGISEKVDFNVFSGNEWQLKAICKP